MSSPLYTHPAITVSAALYDERDPETDRLRDLEPHEEAFRSEVERIRNECVATAGQAARQWGCDSRAAEAVRTLAERKCAADLTAALESYRREVEAQDFEDENEAATQEQMWDWQRGHREIA